MRVIIFSIIPIQRIISDMMYTNSYDILETTSYIILYISQKANHILKTAHMSSKPENLLIYCDTRILIYVIVLLSQTKWLIYVNTWFKYK